MSDSATRIAMEVVVERRRQVEDLGFDEEHDDRMEPCHWSWLLARRAVDVGAPFDDETRVRHLLLEIAAIAVAGMESLDRKAATLSG